MVHFDTNKYKDDIVEIGVVLGPEMALKALNNFIPSIRNGILLRLFEEYLPEEESRIRRRR